MMGGPVFRHLLDLAVQALEGLISGPDFQGALQDFQGSSTGKRQRYDLGSETSLQSHVKIPRLLSDTRQDPMVAQDDVHGHERLLDFAPRAINIAKLPPGSLLESGGKSQQPVVFHLPR